jgi:predicted nucleic acid-binding protein
VIFLDTSVLVAIAQVDHVHHVPSRELWNGCAAKETAVSAHTLAEFYSSVTSMPPGVRLSGRDAMLALETFLRRIAPIALTANEYIETLKSCAAAGLTGGTIYDALHVACARKVNAERIYTWNVRHFQRVAPDLAERIVAP